MKQIKLLMLKVFSDLRQKNLGKCAEAIIYNTNNGLLTAPIEDVMIARHLGFHGNWNLKEF